MKKRIAMWAVAAPVLAGSGLVHAQGIQIYGVMDEFLGRIETKTADGTVKNTVLGSGGFTTSYLGFRGQEDLGDGLKAVFALETFLRADTGQIGRNNADPFFGRLAIAGFDSRWGRLTFGRHVTPYSLATTQNTPFLGGTTVSPIFQNVYNLNVAGGTRMDNAVQYSTPVWAGLSADVLYSLGQERPSGAADRKRDRATEAVARYATGAFRGTIGYHRINLNASGDGHEQDARMAAGVYDFKVVKLSAQFHRVRDTYGDPARDARRRTAEAGASIPVGSGSVLASYARTNISDNSATTPDARRSFAVGYDHFLSKRTDLYAAYFRDKLRNPLTQQTTIAVGLRHRF